MASRARNLSTPGKLSLLSQKDSSDPFNESFSFTQEEFAQLKKLRPDLFDPQTHPQERVKLWKTFANTSVGRAFRTT
jgi:hypothetical protein